MRAALLLLALALAGCSRDRNAFSIDLTDTGLFAPATLRVPLGATVIFRNAGTQPREVFYEPGNVRLAQSRPPGAPQLTPNTAAPANAAPWRSGTLYPGETWSHTFTQSGAYAFQSPYAAGFTGTPSTTGAAYGDVQGQQTRFTNPSVRQVPVGIITVETVRAGAAGDNASNPQDNPPFPTPAAPPGGND
ncbi:hypothetical protein [Deinococcus aluminii]|uniref:Plastocyanin n=1 Tax=Deinococcus aluminii TaxID=1656885 RepID=A0ABP9XFR8_9DEIO